MTETMRDLLMTIVADAFDAGAITDEQHDTALTYLNGSPLHDA